MGCDWFVRGAAARGDLRAVPQRSVRHRGIEPDGLGGMHLPGRNRADCLRTAQDCATRDGQALSHRNRNHWKQLILRFISISFRCDLLSF